VTTKHPIRFGIQTGQQLVEWNQLRDLWHDADEWGYDSLWDFDHFYPIFLPDPTGPCLEGWTTLAGLSQHTKRAQIGAMVNGNTYRNPCILAKMAATLDHMSGGRLNLGIGAGWFELEHRSFGIDFKTIPERLQALDEALTIIKGMFTQDKTTLHGRHYHVTDAVCNPRPLQKPHPPILIGGRGEKTLLKLVAKHADMYNATGASPDYYRHLVAVIERHGDRVGRNTDEIEKTVMIPLCYRASKEREQMMLKRAGAMSGLGPDEARKQIMIGDKAECIDKVDQYLQAGATHLIFTLARPLTPDDVQAFAEEVIPAVRGK
jgi:F420-dependent oxidoreductase-like protein